MQESTGVEQKQRRSPLGIPGLMVVILVIGLIFGSYACRNKGATTVVRPVHHHRYHHYGKDRRTRRTKTVKLKPVKGKAPKPPKKKKPKLPKGTGQQSLQDSTAVDGAGLMPGDEAQPSQAMPESIPY